MKSGRKPIFAGALVSLAASMLAISLAAMLHSQFQINSLFGLLSLFLVSGGIFSFLGINMRIAKLRLESACERAESNAKAKERALAIVSHDLKNPLTTIRMNAELIELLSSSLSDSRLREAAELIKRSTDRMTRLIADLLDYEKIRSGHLEVDFHPESVAHLFTETLEMMRPIATRKSLHFEHGLPSEELFVQCDRERIIQVFSNLIGNSIKFTSSGGLLSCWAERIQDHVQFALKDTGCGIPDEYLPHIFDCNWKAPGAAREGAGLGLFISKGIIEAHGGRIWLESMAGQGTTFFFTLPVASAPSVKPLTRTLSTSTRQAANLE